MSFAEGGVAFARSEIAFLKNHEEALHEIDDLIQRWNDEGSLGDDRLVESYINREMSVCVEVRLKECNTANFVAVFERKGRLVLRNCDGLPLYRRGSEKFYVRHASSSQKYSPMFVGDVELIQLPENVPLASTIRLQTTDDFFDLRPDPCEKASGAFAGKLSLVPTYREIGFTQHVLRDVCGVPEKKSRGEAVERASEVVDHISDTPTPLSGDIFEYVDAIDMNSWLRLFIHPEAMCIAGSKLFYETCEIVKVFYGPIDLYPATEQRIFVHGGADGPG